jgi:hypothetical protein
MAIPRGGDCGASRRDRMVAASALSRSWTVAEILSVGAAMMARLVPLVGR